MKRIFWITIGVIAVALAIAGIILPFFPTVPFLLLAAFSFSKTSPRLHNWIITHPLFGPMISDWRTSGRIRRPAKILATVTSIIAFAISLFLQLPIPVLLFQMVMICGVTAFIWSRPD